MWPDVAWPVRTREVNDSLPVVKADGKVCDMDQLKPVTLEKVLKFEVDSNLIWASIAFKAAHQVGYRRFSTTSSLDTLLLHPHSISQESLTQLFFDLVVLWRFITLFSQSHLHISLDGSSSCCSTAQARREEGRQLVQCGKIIWWFPVISS